MKTPAAFALLFALALASSPARQPGTFFQRMFDTSQGSRPVLKPQPALSPSVGTNLVGDFVVTAQGGQRLVLRSAQGSRSTRVVVELGSDEPMPAEGAKLVLAESEGYTVKRVLRGQDGTLTLYVSRNAAR